ncbi:M20/M25/M40 family metallo-hydrolase [Phreatobacter sp.]|uniref:M20/M25/M40 family metallo-hydrolase n=1 Tax=Phreatobacter sp. TaxID=1966341 RepID=UPI0022C6A6FA|nr:M20/M25/M40 family metallo-hydrolase [Phreatobacter sp.]MCZ8314390.1 M20/M25/M40 family metallo-hydrolase [Phreatobacter sp.]
MIQHDAQAALDRLMRFLSIEGVTGEEKAIAEDVAKALQEAGVPAEAIAYDDANTRIPVPTQTGNLIVKIPGRGALGNAEPIMFMTHLDTVPLCAGAKPRITGDKIVSGGDTALGGDNRTGCAVLVSLAAELAKQSLDHPPLVLVFCVREESGLWGARYIDLDMLGPVSMGFNYDGSRPADVVTGAVGGDGWSVEIFGRASHAGVAPERGISSSMVAAMALADAQANGWFGKVVKGDKAGTSNVGTIAGKDGRGAGDATNVVTDYCYVEGESRSHDMAFVDAITDAFEAAFVKAGKTLASSEGKTARVVFSRQRKYHSFSLDRESAVVRRGIKGVEAIGLAPNPRLVNGGLDANYLCLHGIPTVTFGAGQNEAHTVDEWVDIPAFQNACRLAIALATAR